MLRYFLIMHCCGTCKSIPSVLELMSICRTSLLCLVHFEKKFAGNSLSAKKKKTFRDVSPAMNRIKPARASIFALMLQYLLSFMALTNSGYEAGMRHRALQRLLQQILSNTLSKGWRFDAFVTLSTLKFPCN